MFDGKIGVWPFVEEVTTQRNNIKRKRGTKEIKPIQSINRQVIKENIIKQVKCIAFHSCHACNLELIVMNTD